MVKYRWFFIFKNDKDQIKILKYRRYHMKRTRKKTQRKSSGKRIAVRATVLVVSLLFILSGLGLTYVQTMLNRIDRTEIQGDPKFDGIGTGRTDGGTRVHHQH